MVYRHEPVAPFIYLNANIHIKHVLIVLCFAIQFQIDTSMAIPPPPPGPPGPPPPPIGNLKLGAPPLGMLFESPLSF